jgi:hypothetical protein
MTSSRQWKAGDAEPHVLVVEGKNYLAKYDTDAVDILDASYAGHGWENFMRRVCDAVGIPSANPQVILEILEDRAKVRPIVLYVGNAAALAKDCGEELVRFIAFWEEFTLTGRPRADPMFLVLQMPTPA